MYNIPKKSFNYLFVYLLFALASGIVLLMYSKINSHLMLNAFHHKTLDIFMQCYTFIAEYPIYIVALIPLFFKLWRWTVFYAVTGGIIALIVDQIKDFFIAPRPVTVFKESHTLLPAVPGERLHEYFSFPSGHTCTFFFISTVSVLLLADWYTRKQDQLAPAFRKKTVQQCTLFLPLFFAILGGYSRIYLSQHFLMDVLGGSIIGVVVPCLLFLLFGKYIVKE